MSHLYLFWNSYSEHQKSQNPVHTFVFVKRVQSAILGISVHFAIVFFLAHLLMLQSVDRILIPLHQPLESLEPARGWIAVPLILVVSPE